jgi:DNA repair protein RecO (recombination protein O)
VLRHSDWGEADRLLTLYAREQGKVRAIAKGVRKMVSRKAGHLEPFTRVTLQLARGRDLWIVAQAETVEAYLPVRANLMLTGYAAYVIELLDRFSYEEETANPAVYRLLAETLTRLGEESEPRLCVRYYEVRLLGHLGFRPHLFDCANCGAQIEPEAQYFSAEMGGVLCPRCGAGLPNARAVSVETLKYLRHFQRSSYADARRARPDEESMSAMETLMQHYLTYLLERELNTPGFLRQIRKE